MLKIGLIGFGFIAQYGHTPFYIDNPYINIIGVVDPCKARLSKASIFFPNAKLFCKVGEMLDELTSQIDIVDICAPPYAHYASMVESINRGIHVMCEKPLVVDSIQIEKVISLSKSKGVMIYPCHNYHFSPIIQLAKEFIQEGCIGTPQKVILHTYRTKHAMGIDEWIPNWRRIKKYSGGGILMDHGPHSIYIIHELLGYPEPLQASCILGNSENRYHNTEDTVQLELQFCHEKYASIFLTWASAYRKTRYLVIGTSGSLELDDDKVTLYNNENITTQDTKAKFNDPSHSNWFGPMFLDFQRRIISSDAYAFQFPLLEASMVSRIISAAYASIDNRGQWIAI